MKRIYRLTLAAALFAACSFAAAQATVSVFAAMDTLDWLEEGVVFHTVTSDVAPQEGQFFVLRCDVERALRTDAGRICADSLFTHCVLSFTAPSPTTPFPLKGVCLTSDGSWHTLRDGQSGTTIGITAMD